MKRIKLIVGVIGILIVLGIFFIFNQSGKSIEVLDKEFEEIEIPSLDIIDEQLSDPTEQTSNVKEFDITAKQWQFSPSTIEVKRGDMVILNIKSIDVTHGFALPNFGIDERLSPGNEVKIEFLADKEGTFYFACSVSCGVGHSGMRGKIVIN